ncbi:MAG TPA: type II secretion system protein GspG [Candidatus Binatia bacterium]|jgi:type II secretory pathway pseudopilin PulG|nr:type II secretion system protein GspG [Candidatus Binatia bacterium]
MDSKQVTTNGVSRLRSGGFTLIEIIVILAVISVLVAFLTPSVLKYIADAQSARAQSDIKTLQAVVNDLIKDTGQYPGAMMPATKTFLCGPGNIATAGATGWAASATPCTTGSGVFASPNSLANHLVSNDPSEEGTVGGAGDYRTTGNFRWKGPYAQGVNTDPWGNAYEINVTTLVGGNTSPTWIISAGPNGTFETATTATSIASTSDDIGLRIK